MSAKSLPRVRNLIAVACSYCKCLYQLGYPAMWRPDLDSNQDNLLLVRSLWGDNEKHIERILFSCQGVR